MRSFVREVCFPCIFCSAWPLSPALHASIFGCQITRKSIKVTAGPGGASQSLLGLLPGVQGEQEGRPGPVPNCASVLPKLGEHPEPPNSKAALRGRSPLGRVSFSIFVSFLWGDWRPAGSLGGAPGEVRPAGAERAGRGARRGRPGLACRRGWGAGLPDADPCTRPLRQPRGPRGSRGSGQQTAAGGGGEGPRPKARL